VDRVRDDDYAGARVRRRATQSRTELEKLMERYSSVVRDVAEAPQWSRRKVGRRLEQHGHRS
jgi:hypothetical protein